MPAKSSVKSLPPELRDRLHKLLDDPNITQRQIADALNAAAGEQVVSKSGVNRYAVRMRKFAERNRQATEAAKACIAEFGAEGQQQISEVLIYQLRTTALDIMDLTRNLRDQAEATGEDEADTAERMGKLLAQAARSIRDIEISADRSGERRRRLQVEVEAAADKVERTARSAGIPKEAAADLRQQVLGIGAA